MQGLLLLSYYTLLASNTGSALLKLRVDFVAHSRLLVSHRGLKIEMAKV